MAAKKKAAKAQDPDTNTGDTAPAAPADPKPKASKADTSHLVTVTKDGQSIDVHPSAVARHKAHGWVTE